MEDTIRIGILGGLAAAFDIVSIVFNVVFACSISDDTLSGLKVLLFVAFALNLVSLAGFAYFTIFYRRKLQSIYLGRSVWFIYIYGVAVASVAIILSLVTLAWATTQKQNLPKVVIGQPPMTIIGVWFAMWALSMIFQIAVYILLGIWTSQALKTHSIGRMDLDFGIHMPQMDQVRPNSSATRQTFQSQDATLHSPPRTPTSRTPSTAGRSSATRVAPASSSKTKLVKGSARSSFDNPAFPAGEAVSIDSAFDSWDTSSVHREMRAAVHSSPPTRSGLETIPGSRPDSPANILDGPFLPSSPIFENTTHATSAETAEAIGWDPTSPLKQIPSSPPSSPPNFSRPTSKPGSRPTSSHQGRQLGAPFGTASLDQSLQELIHPLFRETSPEPPPVAVSGTMVTASPMANEPITPKTLARIRSTIRDSKVPQWHRMSSGGRSERPSTAGSATNSIFGSPGPSIVDEDEDVNSAPILPGFVMSAGQRTSLVGYGKRKSVKKDRRQSQMSTGSRASRLSQLLMSAGDYQS